MMFQGASAASFLSGLGIGLSLIVAIGAQNAFVLKQGLLRQHVLAVCLFCAASDAALIAAGVAGAGAIARNAPWFLSAMRWGGAAFLLYYGFRSARAARRGGEALRAEGAAAPTLAATLATIAALTWLNPHVWLDTVVLLGSVSSAQPDRLAFALGAMSGSFLFFFSLGYGARLLGPLFVRPVAWRILDAGVALVMWTIAATLILGA